MGDKGKTDTQDAGAGVLRCPTNLGAAARTEWRRQRDAIEARGMDAVDFAGALEEYARQYDLVKRIDRDWRAAGSPLMATATAGQTYQHPLLKMLGEHRKILVTLGDRVGASPKGARSAQPAKAPGRPKGSPGTPGLTKASSRTLELVKGRGKA